MINNNILINFVLCSRKRPELLLKFINSVYETSDNPDQIGIYVKLDDDDTDSLSKLNLYSTFPNVKIKIASRLCGYECIETFINEMLSELGQTWISIANDDTYLVGKGWDTQLKNITENNSIVHPNQYGLNTILGNGDILYENTYENLIGGTPFYFVPNQCWRQYGLENVTHPYDVSIYKTLINNSWQNKFINLKWVHDRLSTEILMNQRQND
jgi:hypothetical protein